MSEGYIGFTVQPFATRMLAHRNAASQNKPHTICKAIRKYGWDALVKTVLCVGDKDYCLALEKRLRPKEHIGWNIGIGGGAAFIGCKHSPQARQRMSAAMKGKPKSAEARIKVSIAHKGRKHTEQARKNMSRAAKLRGFTEQHKKNISKAKKGIVTAPTKWVSPHANKAVWLAAEELYRVHLCDKKKIAPGELPEGVNVHALHRMRERFRNGWNPHTDAAYQEWKANLAA
jgi:group I intron endonuclease